MKLLFATIFVLFSGALSAQNGDSKVAVIGFYNFENLFDTIDGPNVDEEFLPNGLYRYTGDIYREKLLHLSEVVSQMGAEVTADGPAILGVAEIENRSVLEDFARQPLVAKRNYQIVHFNSPDIRGVDVALLYQPKYFKPVKSRSLYVDISKPGDTTYTRDVLYVYGMLDGEPLHIFVNHWPSRRGGEEASRPLREKAAAVNKKMIDSIMAADPKAKVVVMGDLNDDPVNSSIKNVLQAKSSEEETCSTCLYNPWEGLYKKGIGTLAYQDAWGLFDQIIISGNLLPSDSNKGFHFVKQEVFNRNFLVQKSGQFKGYPFRTYAGNTYLGGYSDHFPTLLYFLKPVR